MKTFLNTNFKDAVYVQKLNSFNTMLADGQFPASGSFIDVRGYARVAFLILVGTLDSALTVKVQQATAANGTLKDVSGATTTIGATDDNKFHVIEVLTDNLDTANGYRYVTLDVAGAVYEEGVDAEDYAALVFLGLAPDTEPVTQPAACVAAVVVAG